MLTVRKSVLSLLVIKRCINHFKHRVPKITSSQRALEYVDAAFTPVYGSKWPSIRLALLCKKKYIAVINTFVETSDTEKLFMNLGAEKVSKHYQISAEKNVKKFKEIIEKDETVLMEHSDKLRPSMIKLSDDELAALAKQEPEKQYPLEYIERAQIKGDMGASEEIDFWNRYIGPDSIDYNVHDHIPSKSLKGLENWVEETDVFNASDYINSNSMDVKISQDPPINWPQMLKVFSFGKGDISDFPKPKLASGHVLNYIALDGASLLPVLLLDIQPGDRILDVCAAPGGKSLLALQTCLASLLVCNDVSLSRVNRIKKVFRQYIPEKFSNIHDSYMFTQQNGCMPVEHDLYDKVLVDVPCLTDRVSLNSDDNNIFSPRRVKERLNLPEVQAQLLLDFSLAVRPLSFLYRFGNNLGLKYGQIILPSLLANYGPLYCAKIKKIRYFMFYYFYLCKHVQ